MIKSNFGEKWKPVEFGFEFINKYRMEVSNFGRVRTFHKTSNGDLIKGSYINGYKIIRLKFFKKRKLSVQKEMASFQKNNFVLARVIKEMQKNNEAKKLIKEATQHLEEQRKILSTLFKEDVQKRTINYHALIHRLVADYFLKKPKEGQTIVAHIDHDKLNNSASNLKWMTPEENYEHQKSSPFVIKEKERRKNSYLTTRSTDKLTVTKVMLLKKLLNAGKPMKALVKQFKVTETQIYRIKRGENWTSIKAAE